MSELTKTRQQLWVNPTIDCNCECSDEDNNVYHITYEIPGVKKDDIHLKVIKSGVRLVAHKDNIDYINEFAFQCDVDTSKTLAAYEDGVLIIDAPYDCPDPFKDAGLLKIN
ncbi:MAG: Hsp20/alpha crystallin family protein [Spirochaetales bacterium]|nr:Hsp20/alpha crystallin family protein [Spirochaetales bacterium]